MIIIGILLLTLLILGAFVITTVSVVGSIGIILFGDVIVCMAIIVLIGKKLINRKKK